jgi:Virulence factor BrkB
MDQHNAPRLGAAVAFYTLLSLAPVIVIAVAVGAVVYGEEAAQGRLAWEIQGVAGPDVARTIQEIIRGASPTPNRHDRDFARPGDVGIRRNLRLRRVARRDEHNLECSSSPRFETMRPLSFV